MDVLLREIGSSFEDPSRLFGHFTYILLIVSMLQRDMPRLRGAAIAAGVAKVVYRAFFVVDPVSLLWESVFVLVNAGELLALWWRSRKPQLTAAERYLVDAVAPSLPVASIRALVRQAAWRDAKAGDALTTQGQPVGGLIFIEDGVVDILVDGRKVAQCSRGDFLGEMTWDSGNPATATAVAVGNVRYAWFERAALSRTLAQVATLRFAIQASFSRNLIDKLAKANTRADAVASLQAYAAAED